MSSMHPPKDIAVEFKNVDIVFGKKQAEAILQLDAGKHRGEILESTGCVIGVAGASIAIERGEICVLMGLSGSGKSTLLRAVNGLNKVTRGEVWVSHDQGRTDIAHCDENTLRMVRRGKVAMVIVEHHAETVLPIADRAYVMHGGNIVEERAEDKDHHQQGEATFPVAGQETGQNLRQMGFVEVFGQDAETEQQADEVQQNSPLPLVAVATEQVLQKRELIEKRILGHQNGGQTT